MGIFAKKEPENITCRAIIEILGKPKEHVEATMGIIVENIKKADGWKVASASIAAPEEKEQLFVVFADVEATFNKFPDLLSFCFEYMPSSLEVLEPTEVTLSTSKLNGWLNDYLGRLHESDMLAKRVRADNELLKRNTDQIFRNFITLALRGGEKSRAELANITGIKEDAIDAFIAPFASEGWVSKTETGYTLRT